MGSEIGGGSKWLAMSKEQKNELLGSTDIF